MYVNTLHNAHIQQSLNCLLQYKIKKSDEVKVKKNKQENRTESQEKRVRNKEQTTYNQQPKEK